MSMVNGGGVEGEGWRWVEGEGEEEEVWKVK